MTKIHAKNGDEITIPKTKNNNNKKKKKKHTHSGDEIRIVFNYILLLLK